MFSRVGTLSNMAAAIRGLLSATLHQTSRFKIPSRTFRNNHWALREQNTKPQLAEQIYEGVEYIPQKKAKNPMKTVGIAWAIGFPSGIILFLLTKREVDKNRLKQLKVRQKMKASNEGEYERERYRTASLEMEGLAETKA